jgi:hypothetical protein
MVKGMSSADLLALWEGHAFDPAPPLDELYRYHVPFDDLVGRPVCEKPLGQAIRRGEQIALVGGSGSGKSSVIGHVLNPLVEGLAPLPIPVAVERPEIARDPVEFAGHVVRTVARYVEHAHPRDASRTKEMVDLSTATAGPEHRFRRIGGGIGWLEAKVELAVELGTVTQPLPRPSSEVLDQARAILDLIGAHDLLPVLVFDDTDKWFGAAFPHVDDLIDGFFGRVVRLLAEELAAPTVLAVHNSYLRHPAYQPTEGFIETTIRIPRIPDLASLAKLLSHRAGEHGIAPEVRLMEDDALAALYAHYTRVGTSDIRRRVLFVVHTALALAWDEGAETIDLGHIELAIAETAPEEPRA